MSEEWIQGTVVENVRWTEQLHSLRIEADIAPFTAGQFTRLALDVDGERIARPYSLVNAPDIRPLEFYFITVPHGPLSQRLYALNEGDFVWVAKRPAGHFTLTNVSSAKTLWLLSTGTALGVFLSILRTQEPWERFERVVLVHGVRTSDEQTYLELLAEIGAAHPGRFHVIHSVTRPGGASQPENRITTMIQDGRLEAEAGARLDPESCQIMICGRPEMVSDTLHLLEKRGLAKNRSLTPGQITTEKYW
ncbi:MAG: ferredoxin--NADP(+) reductase [Gammaproteobacteria bacterium]|nr:ferredoxin--NADP(+) reductase [Gammaproteobacteria bacterium]